MLSRLTRYLCSNAYNTKNISQTQQLSIGIESSDLFSMIIKTPRAQLVTAGGLVRTYQESEHAYRTHPINPWQICYHR